MGYMRHHAIIVTTFDDDRALAAYSAADGAGLCPSAMMRSQVNGYTTFLCPPDGSKEGWTASDVGDERRELFVAWLNAQRYEDGSSPFDWCEVQYGDDNGHNLILRTDETEPVPAHLRSTP